MYLLGSTPTKVSVAITKDSISLDPSNSVDGSGFDLCGPRNYAVMTAGMTSPSYITVQKNSVSNVPTISIVTDNL